MKSVCLTIILVFCLADLKASNPPVFIKGIKGIIGYQNGMQNISTLPEGHKSVKNYQVFLPLCDASYSNGLAGVINQMNNGFRACDQANAILEGFDLGQCRREVNAQLVTNMLLLNISKKLCETGIIPFRD